MPLPASVQGFLQLRDQLNAKPALRAPAMASTISTGAAYTAGGPGPSVPASGIRGLVQQLATQKGWSGGEWDALNRLIMKESGYRNTVKNPRSSAYGIFQFLDSTWKPYGPKTSDPRLQTQYGLEYIRRRYGSPSRALNFHLAHGWY